MQIKSPQELLEKIQKELGRNIPTKVPIENEEYQRKIEKKAKTMGVNPDRLANGVDNLIERFWDDIEMLDTDEVQIIKDKIAIGNAKIDSIRARIIKKDDFYAIVFDFGLYMYLNKNLKLLYASQKPDDVIFCNRIEKEQYSGKIFREFRDELSDIYKGARRVLGTMIILKPEVMLVEVQLYFIELYILCHELGHFFNGDLDDKKSMVSLYDNAEEKILRDDESQLKEINADLKGFQLVLRILVEKNKIGRNIMPPELILPTLITMFDIFTELAPKKSDSHPHPIDRLLNIIDVFYGNDATEFIIKTYEIKGFSLANTDKFVEYSNSIKKYFEESTTANNV
jgi:hypothetical protein